MALVTASTVLRLSEAAAVVEFHKVRWLIRVLAHTARVFTKPPEAPEEPCAIQIAPMFFGLKLPLFVAVVTVTASEQPVPVVVELLEPLVELVPELLDALAELVPPDPEPPLPTTVAELADALPEAGELDAEEATLDAAPFPELPPAEVALALALEPAVEAAPVVEGLASNVGHSSTSGS